MPTLTAPAAARAVAQQRGLELPAEPTEPEPPASPNPKISKKPAWLEQQRAARDKLWPLLREVFGEVFKLPPVPLAVGIHRQILDVAGDEIDAAELSRFLRYWCSRWSYLVAVWRGEPCRNLDGSPAGAPTLEQRNAAGRQVMGPRYRPIVEPQPSVMPQAAD